MNKPQRKFDLKKLPKLSLKQIPKIELKKKQKPPENKKAPRDIYAARKRRKRRKILQQSAWLLLLAVIILVLYQRRDSWIPKLETIGQRHSTKPQASSSENSRFPIFIYGDTNYQLGEAGGKLLLLTDSYLQIYEPDGTPIASRQHSYGNVMMQSAGEFALLYESGGKHFRLETPEKQRFEKTLSDPIVFGRVAENGLTAVVVSADTCACKLYVFNEKGQQIYQRSCVERLVDLSFNSDNSGCYAVSIFAEDGGMRSVVHAFYLNEKTDLWVSQPLDTLAISVYNTSVDDVFILGDTMCCYLSAGGDLKSSYVYTDKLECGRCSGDTAALLLANDEKRIKSLVLLNGSAETPMVRTYDKDVKDIGILPDSFSVLVQQRKQFEIVSITGSLQRAFPVADGYDGFLRIGSHIYLRGYDRIDTITNEFLDIQTE